MEQAARARYGTDDPAVTVASRERVSQSGGLEDRVLVTPGRNGAWRHTVFAAFDRRMRATSMIWGVGRRVPSR